MFVLLHAQAIQKTHMSPSGEKNVPKIKKTYKWTRTWNFPDEDMSSPNGKGQYRDDPKS